MLAVYQAWKLETAEFNRYRSFKYIRFGVKNQHNLTNTAVSYRSMAIGMLLLIGSHPKSPSPTIGSVGSILDWVFNIYCRFRTFKGGWHVFFLRSRHVPNSRTANRECRCLLLRCVTPIMIRREMFCPYCISDYSNDRYRCFRQMEFFFVVLRPILYNNWTSYLREPQIGSVGGVSDYSNTAKFNKYHRFGSF